MPTTTWQPFWDRHGGGHRGFQRGKISQRFRWIWMVLNVKKKELQSLQRKTFSEKTIH
jgi:hypothetical protein